MERADDGLPIAELLDERRHLLDVACRMLGSGRDAERVVDEAYRRWYGLSEGERERIGVPRSWLAGTVGGICVSRPTPPERDRTPEEEISGVPPNAPYSWAERARRPRRELRARPATPQAHDTVARAVRHACTEEDEELLASLLAPDATAFFDGGGKVRALVAPVHGDAQVARSMLRLLAGRPGTTLDTHSINGRTGLVVCCDRRVAAVISLDVADHRVVRIWAVLNPDKLRSWNGAWTGRADE